MKKITLLIMVIGLSLSAFATTDTLNVDITNDSTLTQDTIYVDRGIIVVDTATLTINPGVVLRFKGDTERNLTNGSLAAYILVKGEIIAEGTFDNRIVFEKDGADSWGGVYLTAGADTSSFKFCNFTGSDILMNVYNLETYDGALSCYNDTNTVISSFFNNNNTGIETKNSSLALFNSIFNNNQIGLMAGASNNIIITNSTFTMNNDGVVVDFSPVFITNSIIYNNTTHEIYNLSGIATVTYSDIKEGYTGTGNIDIDPMLTAEFKLDKCSEAINVGNTNAAILIDANDYFGNTRVFGTIVDMGAFEHQLTPNYEQTDSTIYEMCEGDSLQFNSVWHFEEDTFSTTYTTSVNYCDSTINIIIAFGADYVQSDTTIYEMCEGDSLQFNSVWYDTSGIYTTTFSPAVNYCDSTINFEIIVKEYYISPDTVKHILCGAQTIDINGTTYSTDTTFTITVSPAINYCDSSYIVNITKLQIPTLTFEYVDPIVCPGNKTKVTAILVPDTFINITYAWTSNHPDGPTVGFVGNGTNSYINNAQMDTITREFYLTVNVDGCSISDTVDIGVFDRYHASLGNDTSVCRNFILDAGPNVDEYLWTIGNETTQTITIVDSAMYEVRIIDTNRCVYFEEINVNVMPTATVNFINDTITIFSDGTAILNAAGLGYESYEWNTAQITPTITVVASNFNPGIYTYWLNCDFTNGCGASDTVIIKITDDVLVKEINTLENIIVYPNPNNGLFNITGIFSNNGNVSLSVFDITGRIVLNEELGNISNLNHEINLTNADKGIYFVKINFNNKTDIYKVSVE